MNNKNNIQALSVSGFLLLLLAVILFFGLLNFRTCCNSLKYPAHTHSDTIWAIDTFKPSPIVHTKDSIINQYKIDTFTRIDTTWVHVDTSSIIENFLHNYITYSHTYFDSLYTLSIIDTIHQNALFGRSLNVELYCPSRTITHTHTHTQSPRWVLQAGASVGVRHINPGLLLVKSNHSIGIGYHIAQDYKGPTITYLHNIHQKK